MKYLVLLIGLAVTGCITPEQFAAQDAAHCRAMGFGPGTDGLRNCMLTLATDRRRSDAAFADQVMMQNQINNMRTMQILNGGL